MTTPQRKQLEGVLCNPQLRALFGEFLSSIHCDENLRFLDALESYKQLENVQEFTKTAEAIWDKFISSNAMTQINIDAATLESLTASYAKPKSATTFDPALEEVYAMLEFDSLPKFLRSTQYKSSKFGSSGGMCDGVGVASTATALLGSLPKKYSPSSPTKSSAGRALQPVSPSGSMASALSDSTSPLSSNQKTLVRKKMAKLQQFFGTKVESSELLRAQTPTKKRAREIMENTTPTGQKDLFESPSKRSKTTPLAGKPTLGAHKLAVSKLSALNSNENSENSANLSTIGL